MKKKLCMILTLILMITSFAGCGNESGETGQTVSSKDYVYKVTPLELERGVDGYSSLIRNGDYIYAYGYKYEDDGTTTINLALLDTEGNVKEEGKCSSQEGEGLAYFSCDDQGGLYVIKDIYAQEPDEEGNYIDQYYLVKLSVKGEEIFCISLNEIPSFRARSM